MSVPQFSYFCSLPRQQYSQNVPKFCESHLYPGSIYERESTTPQSTPECTEYELVVIIFCSSFSINGVKNRRHQCYCQHRKQPNTSLCSRTTIYTYIHTVQLYIHTYILYNYIYIQCTYILYNYNLKEFSEGDTVVNMEILATNFS